MIEQNLKYYLNKNVKNTLNSYDGSKGYIFVQPWPGGFNNIRMSIEIAICMCYLTNRTIIFPPKQKMYLLDDECTVDELFETSEILIKHLTFDQFVELNPEINSLEELKKHSTFIDRKFERECFVDTGCELDSKFIRNRNIIRLEEIIDDSKIIYFDKNLLGNFYITILTDRQEELLYLIYKSVVLKKEVFDHTLKALNNISNKTFYSTHVRRGDYQYKDLCIGGQELNKNIMEFIPAGSSLYVSTDHNVEDSLFDDLKNTFDCIFFKDIKKFIGEVPSNWIPLIEMLMCSRGVSFVGMELSTFSSYIYRLRGYMNDIQDRRFLLNTEKYDQRFQSNFKENVYFRGGWSREYPDVWKFL